MAALICETCKHKGKGCYCAPNSACSDYEEVNTKHTVFDKFKSMDIDEMAEWLDEYGQFDSLPWLLWFDEKYCNNCADIMCKYEDGEREFPCSYCALNGNCKFFPNLDETPDNKMVTKMWLESEVE